MATKKQAPDLQAPNIVEVQISVVPRGRSVVHMTLAYSDGRIEPRKYDLDSLQIEEIKKLVANWAHVPTLD